MDTPIKRAGVLVAAVGFALLAFGLFTLLDRNGMEAAWRCVLDDGRRHWEGCTPTRWGAWLAFLGLLASVAFDCTLGPLWRWILTGQTRRQLRVDPLDEAARRLANASDADWRTLTALRETAAFQRIVAQREAAELAEGRRFGRKPPDRQ